MRTFSVETFENRILISEAARPDHSTVSHVCLRFHCIILSWSGLAHVSKLFEMYFNNVIFLEYLSWSNSLLEGHTCTCSAYTIKNLLACAESSMWQNTTYMVKLYFIILAHY